MRIPHSNCSLYAWLPASLITWYGSIHFCVRDQLLLALTVRFRQSTSIQSPTLNFRALSSNKHEHLSLIFLRVLEIWLCTNLIHASHSSTTGEANLELLMTFRIVGCYPYIERNGEYTCIKVVEL